MSPNPPRRYGVPFATLAVALSLGAAQVAAAAEPTEPTPAGATESVVVTANRLNVQTLVDRKVYSVATDVQATFGAVGDLLGVIPSIDVDADGVVSLRGDSNVLILVDGKPSPLFSGPSAADNLQSIPAKDIERIEVLTTPPAQYKAEGAAGVINIIMKKKRTEGLDGSVQASLGSGGRSVVGTNLSYHGGPLAASFSGTYRQDYKSREATSDLIAPDPVTGTPVDYHSVIRERVLRDIPPLALTADYALDDRRTLSVQLSRTGRAGLRTYTELNDTTEAGGVESASSRRLSAGHDREIDVDEWLGYEQKFARAGELLALGLYHSTAHETEHYDYTNDSFVPSAPTLYNNLGFHDERTTTEFSADYTLPYAPSRVLKLGYAFERDNYDYAAGGATVDPSSGVSVPDPTLDDDFRYRQDIQALYGSHQSVFGAWTFLLGARAELAQTEGRQITEQATARHRYLRLYPNVHVDRALTDRSTLTFGASRRVVRPDPAALDPYVDREYTPNLRSGNPELRPQYTQSFEAGYGYDAAGASYTLTGYLRRNRDSATDVLEVLGNGLSLATRANLPRNDASGVEITANGHLLRQLGYTLSGNLFRSEIDASALGYPGLRTTSGLNAKLKLDYRPTAADSAQVTVNRQDRRLTPQGYVSAINVVNLGYRHALGARLTAVATLSDAFNGQRYQRIAVTPAFTQFYERRVQGRVLYVGVVQTFGTARKVKPAGFDYDN
ncbi:MAG: TonB-dependent receptor [Proteobacteria bacterium]|nr:TonB-dependent receptor [Pseudomonadota bacterium]